MAFSGAAGTAFPAASSVLCGRPFRGVRTGSDPLVDRALDPGAGSVLADAIPGVSSGLRARPFSTGRRVLFSGAVGCPLLRVLHWCRRCRRGASAG